MAATVRAVMRPTGFADGGAEGEGLTAVGLEGARERVGVTELGLLVDRGRAVG